MSYPTLNRRLVAPESLEHRQLLATTITGTQFYDLNANGVQNEGETATADQLIQLFTPESVDVVATGYPHINPVDIALDKDGNAYVGNLIPPRIHRVDLTTGERTLITQRNQLQQVNALATTPDGNLVVLDKAQRLIVHVDVETGEQQRITQRGKLVNPLDLAVAADGTILVTNRGRTSIVRVDPIAKTQRYYALARELRSPNDLVIADDGAVYFSDASGKIVEVSDGKEQFVVGAGGLIDRPLALAVANSRTLYVINQHHQLVTIDIQTGRQTLVAQSSLLPSVSGLAVTDLGHVVLADRRAQAGDGAVFRIQPRHLVAEQVTNEDGEYRFDNISPGDYLLVSENREGWINTTDNPAPISIDGTLPESRQDIGTFELLSISGRRYHDVNENAVQDGDEPGLAGWTVFVDLDHNGTQSDGEPSATTSANGRFYLSGVVPGTHSIVARAQTGWHETRDSTTVSVQGDTAIENVILGATYGDEFGETGIAYNSGGGFHSVDFTHPYENPVVFAWPNHLPSRQVLGILVESEPVDVVAVDTSHFRYVYNRSYLVGPIPAVRYAVFESGSWQLTDGRLLEVGKHLLTDVSTKVRIELTSPFRESPDAAAQDQSGNTKVDAGIENRDIVLQIGDPPLGSQIGWLAIADRGYDTAQEIVSSLSGNPPISSAGRGFLAAQQHPNVLMISVDDVNDWIGVLGGYEGTVYTPNLDRLMSRGALFDNAIVPSVECNPSRTSIMTGLHPSTTMVLANGTHYLDVMPSTVSVPGFFRQHGYYTAGAGKLFHQAKSGDPFAWDDYAAYGKKYIVKSHDEVAHLDARYFGPVDADITEFHDGRTSNAGVEFLQNHDGSEFFLGLGFVRPHLPWIAPREYFDLYPIDEVVVPEHFPNDLDDVSDFALDKVIQQGFDQQIADEGYARLFVQAYLANISFVDDMIGRVMAALDESPYARNTIVTLWSDHGFHMGEKNHWNKKSLWEETTRVPFAIVAPQVTSPGQTIETVVGLVNLFPTLTDLAGLPTPESIDGHSFAPLLSGIIPAEGGTALVMHTLGNVVRTDDWSLIVYVDGSQELYDMHADRGQHTNLAGRPQYQVTVDLLMAKLEGLV